MNVWCRAANNFSELKLAVALPRSLWACAERHCSTALLREEKTEQGEVPVSSHVCKKHLGIEEYISRAGPLLQPCMVRNPLSMKRSVSMSTTHMTHNIFYGACSNCTAHKSTGTFCHLEFPPGKYWVNLLPCSSWYDHVRCNNFHLTPDQLSTHAEISMSPLIKRNNQHLLTDFSLSTGLLFGASFLLCSLFFSCLISFRNPCCLNLVNDFCACLVEKQNIWFKAGEAWPVGQDHGLPYNNTNSSSSLRNEHHLLPFKSEF